MILQIISFLSLIVLLCACRGLGQVLHRLLNQMDSKDLHMI